MLTQSEQHIHFYERELVQSENIIKATDRKRCTISQLRSNCMHCMYCGIVALWHRHVEIYYITFVKMLVALVAINSNTLEKFEMYRFHFVYRQ